jgi:ubiquinone/menaquinone biosynthesis C-methylase UbiE
VTDVKGEEWYQADDVAESYDEKRFSRGGQLIDKREKRAVLDALSPVKDREILEIACGTGRFTTLLADRGANIVGLDISEPMLQQGRQRAGSAGVADRLELLRGDAERLPFPDDRFDAVLAMRFFHIADTPTTFLSEMRRVTREQVVFDTFNDYSTRMLYNWALPMGSSLYTADEVNGWVERAGLELDGVDHDWIIPYGFFRQAPSRVASAFRALDRAAVGTSLGSRLASVSYWRTRVPE